MKAKGVSVLIVIATLSGAAAAVAQEPDPADEPEAAPAGEEPPPEGGSPPGDAPPLQAAPAPAAPAAAPPDAETTFGSRGQIAIGDDLEMAATQTSVAGSSAESHADSTEAGARLLRHPQPVDRRSADHSGTLARPER